VQRSLADLAEGAASGSWPEKQHLISNQLKRATVFGNFSKVLCEWDEESPDEARLAVMAFPPDALVVGATLLCGSNTSHQKGGRIRCGRIR
jgi:hypothetical protein